MPRQSTSQLITAATIRFFAALAVFIVPVARADVMPRGYHHVDRTTIVRFVARSGWKVYASQRGMAHTYRGDLLRSGDTLSYNGYQALVSLWWVPETRLKELPCDLDSTACTDPENDTAFHPIRLLQGEPQIFANLMMPDSTGLIAQADIYEIRDTLCKAIEIQRTYRIPYEGQFAGTISTESELRPWEATSVVPSRVVGGFGILGFRASKVVVSIPGGIARLRCLDVAGRLRKEMRVASTGGRPGVVDLGFAPRVGEYLVLQQDGRRSVRFVPAVP